MDTKGYGAVLNNHGAIMSASPALAGCCWLCVAPPPADCGRGCLGGRYGLHIRIAASAPIRAKTAAMLLTSGEYSPVRMLAMMTSSGTATNATAAQTLH